jgi:ABC-type uncharacterized transport system auxiliary subunit
MMRRLAVTCGLAAVLLGISACGAAKPSKFYQLRIPESSASSSVPRIDTDLLVGRIVAPHLYRDDRIVYRSSSTQLGAYEYHRWAEPPADSIESLLVQSLRATGAYRSVASMRSNARGDYILRGHLHELDEVNNGKNDISARVDFEVELYSQKSGTVVWSKHYSNDDAVSGNKVSEVVEVLNSNLQRGINQIVAGLADYFAKNPPQK